MINNAAEGTFTIFTFVVDTIMIDRFTKAKIFFHTYHDSKPRPGRDGNLNRTIG